MYRRFIFVLMLTTFVFCPLQAQQLLPPSAPNEVCMEAWSKYKKANALWKTGWGLFGSGMGLAVTGCITYSIVAFSGNIPKSDSSKLYPAPLTFLILTSVGAGMTIASIPCLAVGQVRRKAAQNAYRKNCSSEPPLTFHIQTSSAGLGLAMNF